MAIVGRNRRIADYYQAMPDGRVSNIINAPPPVSSRSIFRTLDRPPIKGKKYKCGLIPDYRPLPGENERQQVVKSGRNLPLRAALYRNRQHTPLTALQERLHEAQKEWSTL